MCEFFDSKSSPCLRIEDLCYSYNNDPEVLKDIFLEIKPGEVFGLLGANGAGKTTLMKLASGVLPLKSGNIFSCGVSLRKDPVGYKKLIAYVPDEPVFYENMKVGEHLDFISDIFSIGKKERKNRIENLCEKFSFSFLMGERISSLSRGRRQKLSLLSALVHEPRLLILDEPFNSLDPLACLEVRKILLSLSSYKCSVFLSTHKLDEVKQLCSKIAIVSSGRLLDTVSVESLDGKDGLEDYFFSVAYGDLQTR